jgi:hypothetical protein
MQRTALRVGADLARWMPGEDGVHVLEPTMARQAKISG